MGQQLEQQQLQQLLGCLLRQLDQAKPQAVSNTLWAVAKFRYLPLQLLMTLDSQHHWARLLLSASPRDSGSIAWALGELGHVDEQLHGALLRQAVQQLQETSNSRVSGLQWLCNICWSVAVLDLQQHLPQLQVLLKACSQQQLWNGHMAAVDLQQLYQTHLWLLDCQLVDCLQGLLGILSAEQLQQCEAAWMENFVTSTATISQFQLQVFEALQQLPMAEWQKPPQLEQLCQPDGVLSIDITATTAAGVQLAVEADGPSHFRWPDSDRGLMGSTLYRNRALSARGYTVVSVPYYEWDKLSSQREKQQWLMAAIKGRVAER
jgi:hypothetical protein